MNTVLITQGSGIDFPIESTQANRTTAYTQDSISSISTIQTQPFLSDSQLLNLCQHYGSQAKLWKQKFLGLLPEVEKRELYTQKGCSSIFEFAAKLGGVSREQVQRVLQLDQRFECVPELKQLLTSGEVSVHKLARVASVATEETQQFWASQSKLLSQPALETLVRDTKSVRSHTIKPNKTEKIAQFDELHLTPQIRQRLLDLQNKGLDLSHILEELLYQREQQIQQEKQRIGEELKQPRGTPVTYQQFKHQLTTHQGKSNGELKVRERKNGDVKPTKPSRYIPSKVKQVLAQEFGIKCAHEQCVNRSINLHHTKRFGLDPSHNPLFLAPLCKQHHEIAHSVDVRVQTFKP